MVTFKLRNTTGSTVPPIADAKEIIPNAVACLFLNQWAMTLITGPNTIPHEIYRRQRLEARQFSEARITALTPTPNP
jgi:hypothetical protein